MVRSALLVAILVLCAGCLAVDSPGAPTTETTGATATSATITAATPSTATATATTETTSYYDCPYLLSVETKDANVDPDGTVVAYADLAEPRRAEFDRALAGGFIELGREPSGWIDRDFVRKDGVVYQTAVAIC